MKQHDIRIYRGDSYSMTLEFMNGSDPVNITAPVLAQIRKSENLSSGVIATFNAEVTGNRVVLTLEPADTQSVAAGMYRYDVQVGDKTKIFGRVEIIGDISRWS